MDKSKKKKTMPENAVLWWNYWLDAPCNKHNPISEFKALIYRPPTLTNKQFSTLTVSQMEDIYQYSYDQLLDNHHTNILNRINNSIYFPHYKSIIT